MMMSERFSTMTGVLIGVVLYLHFLQDFQDIILALMIPLSFIIGLILAYRENKEKKK